MRRNIISFLGSDLFGVGVTNNNAESVILERNIVDPIVEVPLKVVGDGSAKHFLNQQPTLFLDPHPLDFFIAYREDGIKGSGTLRTVQMAVPTFQTAFRHFKWPLATHETKTAGLEP